MSVPQPLAPPPVEVDARRNGKLGVAAGRRLILLLGVGFAWLIPAIFKPTYLWGMAIWNGLLLIAFLVDWIRLPQPSQVRVARHWLHALSIGVASEVTIELINNSGVDLWVSAMDELAPSRWHTLSWLATVLRSRGTAAIAQKFIPAERGDVTLGRVYLRYRSAFDMAECWAVADLKQTVRVYPNFEHARKHSIYLARSRQIELQMRLMRLRGSGSDFESLREYRESDELRSICWTATARRGKLVAKTYRVERSQAVWIVLDCGRLMRTRTEGYSKLDRAVDAALCLAQLGLYSGDRVGLLAYGRAIHQRVIAARGAGQLRHIVEQLAVVRAETPEADHTRAAATLLSLQRQRGLIIWITDLAETAMTPEVIEAAGQLLSRHLVIFVAISEPDVKAQANVLPGNEREMYDTVAAQEMVFRREILLARLREHGAFCLDVAPHQISASVLNQYLAVKERNLI
jgi:uncharacterized protein (DUF58 family)